MRLFTNWSHIIIVWLQIFDDTHSLNELVLIESLKELLTDHLLVFIFARSDWGVRTNRARCWISVVTSTKMFTLDLWGTLAWFGRSLLYCDMIVELCALRIPVCRLDRQGGPWNHRKRMLLAVMEGQEPNTVTINLEYLKLLVLCLVYNRVVFMNIKNRSRK